MTCSFDDYLLDLARRELRRGTALIKLEPQAFDLLAYLVAHRDRVVGRDELRRAIWRGRIVSSGALTTRINAVRRAIGDSGATQRLIRTVARKGFRFVGTIAASEAAGAGGVAGASSNGGRRGIGSGFARPTIAVLPFTPLSGEPEEHWLAAGLASDVVAALSRFRWFSVFAPTPYLFAADAPSAAGRLAAKTGVRYGVCGTVRLAGDRLRVNVNLIEIATGACLWANRFDGAVEDALTLQDSIAATIAGSVEPVLQLAEIARSDMPTGRDPTPYELHLRALPIFSDGEASVRRSLALLERAIALDPNYAPALADASFCYQVLDLNSGGRHRRAVRRNGIALARRALQVSGDPEPILTAAFTLSYFGEEPECAAAMIDQALAYNPNFARGWYMSGMARLYAGQPDPAIDAFETAIRLNPRDRLGRRNHGGIAMAHLFTGRFDEAVPRLRVIVHEFPRWATPHATLAACYAHLGHGRDAQAVARRLNAEDPKLRPHAIQFRDARHQELLTPGVNLF